MMDWSGLDRPVSRTERAREDQQRRVKRERKRKERDGGTRRASRKSISGVGVHLGIRGMPGTKWVDA